MKIFSQISSSLLKVFSVALLLFSSQITMAHWGSKGPYGGSVSAMITVDTNVYIGTFNGGIFRSTNKNLTAWTVRNNGLGSGKISSFTNIGTTVFAGTLDKGIYVTTDIGANWTNVNTGLTNEHVYSLTVSGTTLFAGTIGGGIFRSTDNGASWTAVNTGLGNMFVLALASTATTIYAGTEEGVYVSTDNGDNWTEANTNLSDEFIYTLAVNGTSVYVGTESGVFTSPQSSISWTLENTGLPSSDIVTLYSYNGTLYAGTYNGVYTSSDAGALSWTAQNTGLATDTVTAITYINNRLTAGTFDNGVFKTNIAIINWAAHNAGVNNLETRTFFSEGSLIISATNRGVFVSRDIATSYVRANNGLTDSMHVNSLLFVGTTLYAGTEFGGVFVSADTGRTWTSANTGLSNLNVKYIVAYTTQLATISSTGVVFTTSASSINWTSVPVTFPSSQPITAIRTNGTKIYVSTGGDGVFVFNGFAWSAANTGLLHDYVTDLETLGSKIFASTLGGGVYVSNLSSISWSAANSGLPSTDVYSMGVVGQYVVVGLTGQVYATFDDASTWLPTNVQLNLPAFADITGVGFTSARVFVSTPYNSLYSNAQSELPTIPTSVLNPNTSNRSAEEVLLYPNPAQGVFQIGFIQPDEVLENISVSNVTGMLLQRSLSAEGLMTLDKGVYIITIVTNKGVSTQKLVVQ